MSVQRLVVILGAVLVIIFMGIVIFSIDWGGSGEPVKEEIKPGSLLELADTNAKTEMLVRGPVNNNQEHQAMRIVVGRDKTVGQLLSGYNGDVEREVTVSNNSESYRTFLSALLNASFTKRQPSIESDLELGACPRGRRFDFVVTGAEDDKTPKPSWATTCSRKQGSFGGDLSLTRNLFQAQIPREDYNELTKDSPF